MKQAEIGIYGLGTMGRALALNIAEHGFVTAVANRETDWIDPFVEGASHLGENLLPCYDLESFVARLARPRTVLFMIPSGAPLEAMLDQVAPLLEPGDLVVDAGNADFNDTVRRAERFEAAGIAYVGLGVSGGARGARHGPSMMFGGTADSWTRLEPILTAIAARYEGDACVAHLGPDGAGHFVKTVHNGIEYADMQMIAELYGLLRDAGGWDAGRIADLFRDWSKGPLASFLIDVSVIALDTKDPDSGQPLIDLIVDTAGQKGTGRWTVIEAQKLGLSASTIEAAVAARSWSADRDLRARAEALLPEANVVAGLPGVQTLEQALLAGRILSHAQGFDLLAAASREYDWSLDLARVAEIWRAGCILRSDLLSGVAEALNALPEETPLVLAPQMLAILEETVPALRHVVGVAVQIGQSLPALAAALTWYDSLRRARGSSNMIQAQRDVFGAHGFERTDLPGRHNGEWG